MPNSGDYHAFNSTKGSSSGGGRGGGGVNGPGWIVIIIVLIMLILFIAGGASFDAIDCLLGFGVLAFIFALSLG